MDEKIASSSISRIVIVWFLITIFFHTSTFSLAVDELRPLRQAPLITSRFFVLVKVYLPNVTFAVRWSLQFCFSHIIENISFDSLHSKQNICRKQTKTEKWLTISTDIGDMFTNITTIKVKVYHKYVWSLFLEKHITFWYCLGLWYHQ